MWRRQKFAFGGVIGYFQLKKTLKLDVSANYKPKLNSIYCKKSQGLGCKCPLHPLWLCYWKEHYGLAIRTGLRPRNLVTLKTSLYGTKTSCTQIEARKVKIKTFKRKQFVIFFTKKSFWNTKTLSGKLISCRFQQ